MNRAIAAGVVLTAAGAGGYGLGVLVEYPGRSFSLSLLMVGVALLAMRRAFEPAEVDR